MMDIYEERLLEVTKTLSQCQRDHGFVKLYNETEYLSCNDCKELIGCAVRTSYVEAVYASMSKGAVGGFEF